MYKKETQIARSPRLDVTECRNEGLDIRISEKGESHRESHAFF